MRPLPAPLRDCRFVAFGSLEHEYFKARGWVAHQLERGKAFTEGQMVALTRRDKPCQPSA